MYFRVFTPILFSILAASFLTVGYPENNAYACSCIEPPAALEAMKNSDAVFSGKVVDLKYTNSTIFSSIDPVYVTFEAENVWKGSDDKSITIQTSQSSASCGFAFEDNMSYLVYANKIGENLEVSLCSRTNILENASEDIIELNEKDPNHEHTDTNKLSPLKQVKSGIMADNVKCKEGLELLLKVSNGHPACVTPPSVAKLVERGYAVHVLPDYEKNENNNSEIFSRGNYEVETSNVQYFKESNGYLAKPMVEGQFPGIVMIHEWWGLNDNIKQMADKLASHGYVVLAVDLYEGKVGTTSDEARELMSSFDQTDYNENMNSAVKFLETQYTPSSLGSIGWCFGGGQSLNLAFENPEMDATVIYYGQLVTDSQQLSKIKWPVLGIFAELDQGIPPETVNKFQTSLNEIGVENDITIYSGVNHAFANPSGDRYAPEESKDAWQKTLTFFNQNLN